MRKKYIIRYVLLFITIVSAIGCSINNEGNIHIENANSHDNYFSVHHINQAWKYGKGKGVKIGVLDYLFGEKIINNFYCGGKSFVSEKVQNNSDFILGHGFWMASTLREIAPFSEVYALTTYDSDEDQMTNAIIKAIDWAIENKLNILTYSHARLSTRNRIRLNPYIDKAYEKGIAIVFLHNPNDRNFLPSTIDPLINDINNESKINIYDQDYSVILRNNLDKYGFIDSKKSFKSISSKSVVLAGIIAIMKEAVPNATLSQIHNALIVTTFNYETDEKYIENTVDAYEAVKYLYNNR